MSTTAKRKHLQHEYVITCINDAKEYGVEADVAYYALQAMKESKGLMSIDDAIEAGMWEMKV